MGQAKQRGTRQQRIEQAKPKPPKQKKHKEKPMNILEAMIGLNYASNLFKNTIHKEML